ncbi:hypothetical protein P4H27_00265 [Paenibacillus taichungensis]|uniref:hypothetical protein n=1 Tax=Paenibacillus taichungensis TaxID=484184 RepID=UPI002DBB48D7|nr:hypothetical protein [Paenibacillus taichungensis]MEC0105365.1 hypothetical protein [Paenibacillus taichungensis]MEC0200440.1 hypothetical protein [Paenibacillus taichungensis]
MENLISTIVFVLPGFMLYFWIQMMGVNPVVKHTTIEFGALSAIAWFPVVISSLYIMGLYRTPISNLDELTKASKEIWFLVEFMALSVVVGFIIACLYVWILYPMQVGLVNVARRISKKAKLSLASSVWEEVFLRNDRQVVGVAKLGSMKPDMIGSMHKVARPFEPKRAFKLLYMDHCKLIVEKYEVPIKEIFTDIDSGVNIFIYDIKEYELADKKYRKELEESEKENVSNPSDTAIS